MSNRLGHEKFRSICAIYIAYMTHLLITMVQPIIAALWYVQRYGGKFTKRLIGFAKTFIEDNRRIASSTFKAILDLHLDSAEVCPNFITAVHARSNSALEACGNVFFG